MSATPPDARIVLRARGILEALDLALRFLVRHARAYAALSLFVLVPALVGSLVLRYTFDLDWTALWLLCAALASLLEGPFTLLTGQLAIRDDVRLCEIGAAFVKKLPVFALLIAGAGALRAAALSILVVPWFFAALVTVFLPEVVLLEGEGLRAYRRAYRVVHRHDGRALGTVFILLLVRVGAVLMADATLGRTLGLLLDLRVHLESFGQDGGSPFGLVGLWSSVPLCAVFRYMAYVDLRTRKEGWDLQRRLHVLAARLRSEGH